MAANNFGLTSTSLIAAVKRQAMVPISQRTFEETDILAIANQEMLNGIVPDVLTFFESYFLRSGSAAISANTSSYEIPYRAMGMKLQDVAYSDGNGNLYEMARVQPDERIFFQFTQASFNNTFRFYIENNAVVLVPSVGPSVVGSLEYKYYLRPNELVVESRVGAVSAVNYLSQITLASVTAGEAIVLNSNNLVAGTDFSVTGTDADAASSLSSAIAALGFSSSVSGSVVSVTSLTRLLTSSTDETLLDTLDEVTLSYEHLPSNITEGEDVDFMQSRSGFKTYKFDYTVPVGSLDYVANTMVLPTRDLPIEFGKKDYVTSAGEAFYPQIPVELHSMLVQRTICRTLEALGDTQGMQNAQLKLAEMIAKMGNLIDNRVESAPQKIMNKGSPLRLSKWRMRNFFRF